MQCLLILRNKKLFAIITVISQYSVNVIAYNFYFGNICGIHTTDLANITSTTDFH